VKEGTTFIGLDAHKKTIQVCLLRSNREEPLEWQVVNEPGAVRRMAKKILKEAQGEVLSCYEAGPCGYWNDKQWPSNLIQPGEPAQGVAAPARLRKPIW